MTIRSIAARPREGDWGLLGQSPLPTAIVSRNRPFKTCASTNAGLMRLAAMHLLVANLRAGASRAVVRRAFPTDVSPVSRCRWVRWSPRSRGAVAGLEPLRRPVA